MSILECKMLGSDVPFIKDHIHVKL